MNCHGPAARAASYCLKELTILPHGELLPRARNLCPGSLVHGVHQIRAVVRESAANKEGRGGIRCKMPAWGASQEGLGAGVGDLEAQRPGRKEDLREPREAFSLLKYQANSKGAED